MSQTYKSRKTTLNNNGLKQFRLFPGNWIKDPDRKEYLGIYAYLQTRHGGPVGSRPFPIKLHYWGKTRQIQKSLYNIWSNHAI